MAFAGYAFNKSHAAAYAVIAYDTAWLKYYYPVEFMAAMLNSYLATSAKLLLMSASAVNWALKSCRRTSMPVRPVSPPKAARSASPWRP